MLNTMLDAVKRFHTQITRLPMPSFPSLPAKDHSLKWANHLKEEVGEYIDAIHDGDLPKAADAMIDLIYVAMGRLLEMGVLPGPIFWEVHAANMRKQSGKTKRGLIFDALKPKDWKGPDLEKVLSVGLADVEAMLLYRAVTDAAPGPVPIRLYDNWMKDRNDSHILRAENIDLKLALADIAMELKCKNDNEVILTQVRSLKELVAKHDQTSIKEAMARIKKEESAEVVVDLPPAVQSVAQEGHEVIASRMAMYGPPKDSWDNIGWMWTGYLRAAGYLPADSKVIQGYDASHMMIGMKTIRAAYSYKRDNQTDICGYSYIGDLCQTNEAA